uniref:Uncharacterized protein n=1 Tax=Pararge aegeria TaxID=116150 RepID=S4PDN5_9NEOP
MVYMEKQCYKINLTISNLKPPLGTLRITQPQSRPVMVLVAILVADAPTKTRRGLIFVSYKQCYTYSKFVITTRLVI